MTIYSIDYSSPDLEPIHCSMSSSNCCFLTCIQISQEAGSGGLIFPSLQEFPTVCCDSHSQRLWRVNKAEIDIFLVLSRFFDEPADVGNLISGSSAFSKSSLNIWKFSVHVLLRPCLENFEHYFASMWDECNCVVVWAFFGLPFFGIGMKTDLFQSYGHYWVFQICWHIDCNTLTVSSFRIWNSSTLITSPPLDLFIVMLINKYWKEKKIFSCLLVAWEFISLLLLFIP